MNGDFGQKFINEEKIFKSQIQVTKRFPWILLGEIIGRLPENPKSKNTLTYNFGSDNLFKTFNF